MHSSVGSGVHILKETIPEEGNEISSLSIANKYTVLLYEFTFLIVVQGISRKFFAWVKKYLTMTRDSSV